LRDRIVSLREDRLVEHEMGRESIGGRSEKAFTGDREKEKAYTEDTEIAEKRTQEYRQECLCHKPRRSKRKGDSAPEQDTGHGVQTSRLRTLDQRKLSDLFRRPLIREHLACVFWRDFHAKQFGGVRQHRVSTACQIRGSGEE
jgi:hypothetical protein